jgi:hypothetical protein
LRFMPSNHHSHATCMHQDVYSACGVPVLTGSAWVRRSYHFWNRCVPVTSKWNAAAIGHLLLHQQSPECPFCYIWRVAYISSRQAGLVCLPPLDAVLPRSLCRVTGLDNPSPDYDYVTASIVNDLYHTVLQIRNAYREVNCNERKNTEAFRPKQRQSKFVTHTMKMETKYYEAGIQERLYTHQNHIMGPKIIQLSSTQLHHIFF